MDGKQLKNSILQWAIQGKLVPQNPKDEPAQKLLERIALSRHSERSEESSKRSKKTSKNPPSRIYRENGVWYEQIGTATPKDISDEIPFEIPENWAWCRLGNLIKISSGDGLVSKDMKKGDIPVFGGNGITGYHTEANVFEETVVIGRVGFYCGSVHVTPNKAWVTDNAFITDYPKNEINREFLVFCLKFLDLGKSHNATAQPVVSGKKIYPLFFPLPPLVEQKRIVAKLEQVLPLAEEYGAAQEQLDKLNKELPEALKKSILQEAIQGKLVPQNPKDESASVLLAKIRKEKEVLVKQGKLKKKDLESAPIDDEEIPFEIPDSWTWVRFESIAQRIVGKTPERGNSSYWSKTGYPWVTISDMSDYGHVKATKEFISEKASNLMGTISPKDSLLMSFKLTVGRTSILDIAAYHNEAIITVLPYYDKENILRDYLFTFLPLISLTGKSKDAIKGMTLNSKSIAALLIPLPPLAEQKRIVAKLEQLFKVL